MRFLFFVLGLVAFSVIGFASYPAFAMWISLSPQELLRGSRTIFVGTITSVTPVDVEYQSQISKNGTIKQSVGPEVITLDEYTVAIEEFLQNPQDSDTMTVRQATVGGVPGGPALIGGFEVGDRVLFYLPKDEHQVNFAEQYLPESFKIPKPCVGKDVLAQKRLVFGGDFTMTQNNIPVNYDNIAANSPIRFVYEKDMSTLSGKSFDVSIEISKNEGNHATAVFSKEVHSSSKPCEWIATAEWEFTPEEGSYNLDILEKYDNSTTQSHTTFSAKPEPLAQNDLVSTNYLSDHNNSVYSLDYKQYKYFIPYQISHAVIKKMELNCETSSLVVHLQDADNGNLIISIPRQMLSSKAGQEDADFIILLDNEETSSKETEPYLGARTLDIQFTNDSKKIEIIATQIPESSAYPTCATVDSDESIYHKMLSPLKQFESGVQLEQIRCSGGFLMAIKPSNNHPTCVRESTLEKLMQRGWKDAPVCHGCGIRNFDKISYKDFNKTSEVKILKGAASPEQMKNYSPQNIVVVIGINNTVTWINEDDTSSTVRSDKDLFNSGPIKPSQNWTHIFEKSGLYQYHSEPHPWMKGAVIVIPQNLKFLSEQEKLDISGYLLQQYLPNSITGLSIDKDGTLVTQVHENELKKNQNAESYYKKKIQEIIPFDVPIKITFGHAELQ